MQSIEQSLNSLKELQKFLTERVMFPKILSVVHLFIDLKLISVLVLVLMSTSSDCHSNDIICDFIVRDGRVRDLGIYRFVSNESFSYRLSSDSRPILVSSV